jgi:hypothetical protein
MLVEQLPDSSSLDPETASGLGDSQASITRDEAIARHGIQ